MNVAFHNNTVVRPVISLGFNMKVIGHWQLTPLLSKDQDTAV